MFKKPSSIILVFFLLFVHTAFAQERSNEKYPSLLWEITGNGLTRPSYLFGTMHVSSKMVFHLSDSFYHAIKNVDAVALELNPDLWQGQMVHLEKLKSNYSEFVQQPGNDFLNEHSFRIKNYDEELRAALQTEPEVVNNLLYRSYKAKEDFEEDTFLDLYIFQTGRRLGKKAAGVENFYDAEKLVMEAYVDMAREKKKKNIDLSGETMNDLVEKMQNAYKRGDLDLMDSLDILMERSDAFREKFLYKRNDIQANSIDSIIRKSSLFAGVGAAHLPGKRGVIELLRKKGYILRPVKMADRDALQKNAVDNLKVPVIFQTRNSEDGFYRVDVPGDLYKTSQDYQDLDRRQYADMSNGSYYMVTRIKTHAAFLNQSEQEVMKKVDSVLYENIPGKISSKQLITKNNYPGYDITSKTRRGDVQRYQIFVTPFEIIIFKMSGNENYVAGKEADQFFSSIRLKEKENKRVSFEPAQGGFSMVLPQAPNEYFNQVTTDDRWEYEATDKQTGDAYLVFKKSIYNFNFIGEDSFDLKLIEESFRNPDLFDKQISSRQSSVNGLPVLDVKERLKNGCMVDARFFICGPHYYVVAKRSAGSDADAGDYLNTFSIKPYHYPPLKIYSDSFLRATVLTPVVPEIDADIRKLVEQSQDDAANGYNNSGAISYWLKPKNGLFKSDSTGEMVAVEVQEYPKYFYIKDSAKLWQDQVNDILSKGDMVKSGAITTLSGPDFSGIRFMLRDTGSSRTIQQLLLLKNNFLYNIRSMGDTLNKPGTFIESFFNSFKAEQNSAARNIYRITLPVFFDDLFSTDSALHNKAQQALSNVYYGTAGIPFIIHAINRLRGTDKDYFDTKTKLIAELGFIKDSTKNNVIVTYLKRLYEQTADTSIFQNEIIKSLTRLKTNASYKLLMELLLQDPPIFENSYEYNSIFNNLEDSMEMSATLFPSLLQLATLSDYKDRVIGLLAKLVDSGYVKRTQYEKYFTDLYIDAKVALKKQQSRDEKLMQEENNKDADDGSVKSNTYYNDDSGLQNYSILMMPFYEKNTNVQQFFSRLLQSKDKLVQLNAAVLMLRNDKPVPGSILLSLAANNKYRSTLFLRLEKVNRLDQFPAAYKTQVELARSNLQQQFEYDKIDSIVFLSKQLTSYKRKTGFVYFFKYRVKKEDQWKIGISGLQPVNANEVSSDDSIVEMTDIKLKETEPQEEQLSNQLKKLLFSFHKSGKEFYDSDDGHNDYKALNDSED